MSVINRPDVLAEVDAVFDAYEQALVTNDVAVLDKLFFDSPNTLRYGATENLYGYEAIRAFRAARPGKGLARTVTARVVTAYGDSFAVTHIEFRREGDPRIGRQTQTWVKMPEGWRVVSAHVSWMEG
ncbi:oxalurate catabolism protein HpxZ [Paraburkholderia silviterrae]|uniref:Oxalurate catabolism protein HpxZ n=1 Tax=Paraburkholderia silviterrae TaxID=2528715 RepID=A0A4R5MG35_9BURK|nr:oxalurate catabolism protein HpxZ [Paraburkholderia silviterrae]TDG26007.1 oxalurate catabolism protein HpxZ [Paraburkholderia silviterrae]